MQFVGFPKIARLARSIIITEKIDGSNGQLYIYRPEEFPEEEWDEEAPEFIELGGLRMRVGSRNRWLTRKSDNFGFCNWAFDNGSGLIATLGEGRHFGEWWGQGIQRRYGLTEKRFSLFNTGRWFSPLNAAVHENVKAGKHHCIPLPDLSTQAYDAPLCHVVPVLQLATFGSLLVESSIQDLTQYGSAAARGFMDPEGIVVFHTASNQMFKKTIKNDEQPKGAFRHE